MKTKTLFAASLLSLTFAAPMTFAADVVAPAPEPSTAAKVETKVETAADKTGDYLSDSALTAKVKTALLSEKNLKSLHINVESTAGVVTLSGKVPNEASIEQAGAATKAVAGVKDVHNKIELKNKG